MTINGGTLFFSQAFSSSRLYTMGASGGTMKVGNGQTSTLTTGLAPNGNSLAVEGPGTLALSAASTRTGITNVQSGVLRVNNASALGSGTVNVNGGAVLELASSPSNPVNLANLGTIRAAAGLSPQHNGTITAADAAGTLTLDSGNVSLTLAGYAGGNGSNTILTGSGFLVLPNANTYTGSWEVNGGTLRLGNSSALGGGAGAVQLNNSAIVELLNVTLARPVMMSNNTTLRTFIATATTTEPITVASGANVTLGGSNTTSLTIGNSANDLTGGGGGSIINVRNTALTGKIVLNQASDYAGDWIIQTNATLEIGADDRLGNAANTVTFSNGRLRADRHLLLATIHDDREFRHDRGDRGEHADAERRCGRRRHDDVDQRRQRHARTHGRQRAGGRVERRRRHAAPRARHRRRQRRNHQPRHPRSRQRFHRQLRQPLQLLRARGTGSASLNSTVSVSGSSSAVTLATGASAADVLTLAGGNAIGGGGSLSSITVAGSGTVAIASPSTYTGDWVLAGGVLQIAADNRLGNAANDLFFNGGTLLTSAAVTSARQHLHRDRRGHHQYQWF